MLKIMNAAVYHSALLSCRSSRQLIAKSQGIVRVPIIRSFSAVGQGDQGTSSTKSGDERNEMVRITDLLKFVVCPVSKKPLRFDEASQELISDAAGLAFPIVNGIPNLVPASARQLKADGEQQQSK